jgi:hypothetical protein
MLMVTTLHNVIVTFSTKRCEGIAIQLYAEEKNVLGLRLLLYWPLKTSFWVDLGIGDRKYRSILTYP